MSVYEKLESLSITLPEVTPPVGAFLPFLRSGNFVLLSGHIAKVDGEPLVGRLGENLTTEQGYQAASAVAIDLLGTLHAAVGDLNRVSRITKIMVLVNSTPEFFEQHLVANGAYDLLAEIFGDKGTHVRAAFGVAQIPVGSCVEIDLIAEVAD